MNYLDTNQVEWKDMPVAGFHAKELFSKENGAFKVVKLEPNAKFPIHEHPDKTEFAYVLEGELEVTIGEDTFKGSPGVFFKFPVGFKHSLHNPSQKQTVILIGAVKDSLE